MLGSRSLFTGETQNMDIRWGSLRRWEGAMNFGSQHYYWYLLIFFIRGWILRENGLGIRGTEMVPEF